MDRARSLSVDDKMQDSGYSTAIGSGHLPEVYFSPPHLKFINAQLKDLEPEGKNISLLYKYIYIFLDFNSNINFRNPKMVPRYTSRSLPDYCLWAHGSCHH